MQAEAVAESVRILKTHVQTDTGGSPIGQARGRIILPCGTGKTRISLRIVEQLTHRGGLSIVLCPSIALVAQIRREYLINAEKPLRALAVCSDETAGYDPTKEGSRNPTVDPTVDNSNTSASVIKGQVTTNPLEIDQWIRNGQESEQISVIFGTYQSGRSIADGLRASGVTAQVLVADEAHRTAGLRLKRKGWGRQPSHTEQRVRDFTLCHNNDEMPATYRVYQTATPRIYDTTKPRTDYGSEWIVRSMDDQEVFGVELYRKSYGEAVKNRWLSDYRIIAVSANESGVYEVANRLAKNTKSTGRDRLTTTHFLRGLAFALAMAGASRGETNQIQIKSCIAFMNAVDKSKNMAKDLQEQFVRDWLNKWWAAGNADGQPAHYSLEHLDATSNVSQRDNAKNRLSSATEAQPHGIINVGIFGEGTDSPSLSAVAFLEPRKSPIDVVQAVGRAMRTANDKSMGYIICPIVFPPNVDAETWLSNSSPDDGWQELGQILLALRAHDPRIEDNLAELLRLYIPKPPPRTSAFIGIATDKDRRIQYWLHEGEPGEAENAIEAALEGSNPQACGFMSLPKSEAISREVDFGIDEIAEPGMIITGKANSDGSFDVRTDVVARDKPGADGKPGKLNIRRTKAKAKDMINKGIGNLLPSSDERKKRRDRAVQRAAERQMRLLQEMDDFGKAIRINLLEKSGLTSDRISRDLNILESSVKEAAHHLKADKLGGALNRHFGLDNLKKSEGGQRADGCTIAALLMMNAAMLHQRIAEGGWLSGISNLAQVKNDVNAVRRISREWNQIMRHDFRPVLEPATKVIEAVEDTGKLVGLERALRHLASEAEFIAESYADMGADHAGPLFNRVMGDQASDGAYFTRPVAASLTARLTLDASGEHNWANPTVWKQFKAVDLACGSGTLLAALLTNMKNRAKNQGASKKQLTELQRLAVEETIKGLDINPVSLQLAASQLTAGNQEIRYRQMGLHLMPYGPHRDNPNRVSIGTLELLGQKAVVPREGQLDLADDEIESQATWGPTDDAELEDAVSAARDARIVIMNPPFTNRSKQGEKFPKETQHKMRSRADAMEKILVAADPDLERFADKNSIAPLFVALANLIQNKPGGVVTMINPTIALSATSALQLRRTLAQQFHIHTVLTCHQPGNINMSQHTSINESIIVMRRQSNGTKPPTIFVNLDRMPVDEDEVETLHRQLQEYPDGQISDGWGEISRWPTERIEEGDWSPAIWRSPQLAEASRMYANHPNLQQISSIPGLLVHATGQVLRGSFEPAAPGSSNCFPILKSKGSDGQTTIQGRPDEYWRPRNAKSGANKILEKAGHLLITAGQRNNTARLTAVAAEDKFVGNGWMPVAGLSTREAKAMAVFINSTPGRLQLMRSPGKTLAFPVYSAAEVGNIRIPNIKDSRACQILASCWERTKDVEVPSFQDGPCGVRAIWDDAVAEAMGWKSEELTCLRKILSSEPHVRGLGYNQYADRPELLTN